MRRYWTLLIFCAVSIGGVLTASQMIRGGRLLLEPYRVERGSMSSYAEYGGKLEAGAVEKIYTDMSIYVDSLTVESGQNVKRGELLAKLDNNRLRSALYELDLEKYRSLDVASLIEGYLGGAGIDMFDMPSIDLEAELGLKEQPSALYSPLDGMVLEINAKERDYTKTSRPVFVVADMSVIKVRAYVPEGAAGDMTPGKKAQIFGSGFRGRSFSAFVSSISPVAAEIYEGTVKRTAVEVMLDIPNPDKCLKPGYSANVRFYTDVRDNALRIPYESIAQDDENRTFVYLLSGGRALKRMIETGLENENYVEVTEGLSEGDYIAKNASAVSFDGETFKIK